MVQIATTAGQSPVRQGSMRTADVCLNPKTTYVGTLYRCAEKRRIGMMHNPIMHGAVPFCPVGKVLTGAVKCVKCRIDAGVIWNNGISDRSRRAHWGSDT